MLQSAPGMLPHFLKKNFINCEVFPLKGRKYIFFYKPILVQLKWDFEKDWEATLRFQRKVFYPLDKSCAAQSTGEASLPLPCWSLPWRVLPLLWAWNWCHCPGIFISNPEFFPLPHSSLLFFMRGFKLLTGGKLKGNRCPMLRFGILFKLHTPFEFKTCLKHKNQIFF